MGILAMSLGANSWHRLPGVRRDPQAANVVVNAGRLATLRPVRRIGPSSTRISMWGSE